MRMDYRPSRAEVLALLKRELLNWRVGLAFAGWLTAVLAIPLLAWLLFQLLALPFGRPLVWALIVSLAIGSLAIYASFIGRMVRYAKRVRNAKSRIMEGYADGAVALAEARKLPQGLEWLIVGSMLIKLVIPSFLALFLGDLAVSARPLVNRSGIKVPATDPEAIRMYARFLRKEAEEKGYWQFFP